MRRFYIHQPGSSGTVYTIHDTDANHIINVLRMKTGAEIWLFDGRGYEYKARIQGISSDTVTVEIVENFFCPADPPVRITVGQAVLKHKKLDTTIRQLTELGMDGWMAVDTERSVSKIDDKKERTKTERWQTIVKESVKQCQRGLIPQIYPAVDFKKALLLGSQHDINIIFSDKNGEPLDLIKTRPHRPGAAIFLLLGPEGGFTPREIELARQHGFIAAGLGPRILKADTAAVAACAIVQHLFGDMGKNDNPPE
jgi:16S rRNA (uracil1498-N3)-methyltransferase